MTIVKLTQFVFVGSDADLPTLKSQPAILHAAKEPWHRKFVGYVTRGAPKDSPEYLFATRYEYSELALNLVDVDDPAYVNKDLIDAAVNFVNYHRCKRRNVFIHCNQGLSRAPTIGMLVIAPQLDANFITAFEQFRAIYPAWNPKDGVLKFAMQNWEYYHGDSAYRGGDEGPGAEPGVSRFASEGRTVLGQSSGSSSDVNGDSLDTDSSGIGEIESGSQHQSEIVGDSPSTDLS